MTKIDVKNIVDSKDVTIMKIEKVNEQQIRCTLTREDLANRELKISELAYGTEKAKSLFRDMMRQAAYECGFEAEDIPLMIEAIPLNSECIVLIITKVEDPEELDTRFSKFAPSVHEDDEDDDDEEDSTEFYNDGADEMLNMLRRISEPEQPAVPSAMTPYAPAAKPSRTNVPKEAPQQSTDRIFTFTSLHDVARMARVVSSCESSNTLYKDEAAGSYLLLLNSEGQSAAEFNRLCNLISEYGRPGKTASSTRAFLQEHYEPLIKDNAIGALAQI